MAKKPEKIGYEPPPSTLKADIRKALNKEHHRLVAIAQTLRTGSAARQKVKDQLEMLERYCFALSNGPSILEIKPKSKITTEILL